MSGPLFIIDQTIPFLNRRDDYRNGANSQSLGNNFTKPGGENSFEDYLMLLLGS